jgi:hypothetical protein
MKDGAEVPIAGAYVREGEGQGARADRQTPRENARMTMCRFSFARLQTNENSFPFSSASMQNCCAACVTFQLAMGACLAKG